MSSRVIYTMSVTPVNTIPANTNNYVEHEMIDSQVGGSLVAQMTVPSNGTYVIVSGVDSHVYSRSNRYAGVWDSISQMGSLANGANQLLYIHHTGKKYVSGSELGDDTTGVISVSVNSTPSMSFAINPGDTVILPVRGIPTPAPGSLTPVVNLQCLTDNVAVEALLFS